MCNINTILFSIRFLLKLYIYMTLLFRSKFNLLFISFCHNFVECTAQDSASCSVNKAIISLIYGDCRLFTQNEKSTCLLYKYLTMPFLKVQKATWCEQRIESCKRNGWRHAIYTPEAKRVVKAHYKGEWRNDKREGKGIGVSRCHKNYILQVSFFRIST